MGQAKTLTERELKRVLDYIALHRHAARNRAMVMLTYYAGLRVSEVANLKYADVVAADGTIKAEFQLTAEQVKGGHARMVFVGEKLRKELGAYVRTLKRHEQEQLPLFRTKSATAFHPTRSASTSTGSISVQALKAPAAIRADVPSSRTWQRKVLGCGCWHHWPAIAALPPPRPTST